MENIFSLPGIGKLYVEGIFARDYPVVQVITVVFTVMFLVINLLVDLLYGWLDPRIRYD
jgi:ABC-type dipeptide/oligopeptide/nickel transport system permease component